MARLSSHRRLSIRIYKRRATSALNVITWLSTSLVPTYVYEANYTIHFLHAEWVINIVLKNLPTINGSIFPHYSNYALF